MASESARPRLPILTSIRFFAALHVVLFHLRATKITFQSGLMGSIAELGYTGVSLFFVLSGFILVYTYQGRDVPPEQFFRARFARIYPAYAFSLLLTAPFFVLGMYVFKVPFLIWSAAHPVVSALSVLALLQAWNPLGALAWNAVAWSLSVEAFFYTVFPLVLGWFARRGKSQIFLLLLLFWITSLTVSGGYMLLRPDGLASVDSNVLNSPWLNVVKFNPLARLPEFLLGMCGGMLFLRNSVSRKWATPLVLGALAAILAVAFFSPAIPYPILHTGLLSGVFGALIYGFALGPSWANFLNTRLLVLFGDASYSLYLLHQTVLPPFFFRENGRLVHTTVPWIILAVAVAITVAIGVFKFIEQPLRRKLNPRRNKAEILQFQPT
jgi:peptidoglycan/LPS O-acetylase OafA/YrhL